MTKKPVAGVIIGNRGFFPDHPCRTGRETILKVLEEEGIGAVALTPQDTCAGRKCPSVRQLGDMVVSHATAGGGRDANRPTRGER